MFFDCEFYEIESGAEPKTVPPLIYWIIWVIIMSVNQEISLKG